MSEAQSPVPPERDERLMACVCHTLVLAFGVGMVGGAIIWLLQRGRSSYVAFQALQAVAYQLVGMVVMWGGYLLFGCLFGASLIPVLGNPEAYSETPPPLFFVSLALLVGFPLAVMGAWVLYGLYGALRCLQGRDFRYLWVGERVARYLGQGQATP